MTCWVIDGASLELQWLNRLLSLAISFRMAFCLFFSLFSRDFVGDFILSCFDSFINYNITQPPASMIPPIKSSAIMLGAEVTRSPEFRVKRNEFQNRTIYVEMKHIPCLFLCQTYGKTGCIIGCLICVMERFFLSPLKKKKSHTDFQAHLYFFSCILCGNILELTVSILGTLSTVN